ncbi:hypothetical protein D9M68_666870 [compost metagenome]
MLNMPPISPPKTPIMTKLAEFERVWLGRGLMKRAIPPTTISPPSNSCSKAVFFSSSSPSSHNPRSVPGSRPRRLLKNETRSTCCQWRASAIPIPGTATMVMVVAAIAMEVAWVRTAMANTTIPRAKPVNACR